MEFRSIEVVQNIVHWGRFRQECLDVERKLGRKPTVSQLWHGSRWCDPRDIISSEAGLSVNYARGGGKWGKGLHFAADAAYSCPTFSYWISKNPDTYQVLLCDVLLGKSALASPFDET